MDIIKGNITFTDSDLKEVFELFSSPSKYELRRLYDQSSEHFYERADLAQEYDLCVPKQDYALDALRAVFAFLHRHGYKLEKDKTVIGLNGIFDYFI